MSTISPFLADYLTPTDLVALLNGAVTEATLRNWRCARRGPRHITVGRRVLYSRAAMMSGGANSTHVRRTLGGPA